MYVLVNQAALFFRNLYSGQTTIKFSCQATKNSIKKMYTLVNHAALFFRNLRSGQTTINHPNTSFHPLPHSSFLYFSFPIQAFAGFYLLLSF